MSRGRSALTAWGRWMTWFSIVVGPLLFVGMAIPDVMESVQEHEAVSVLLNGLGAVLALAVWGSWFLAVYHWGLEYPSGRPNKVKWGLAVTFGLFLGAWAYWLFGAEAGKGKIVRNDRADGS